MATRYFIELAYDGTEYHGWQIQPNAKSIQETLNKALSTVLRSDVYTVGCGRTDTGVHATQFFAHFELGEQPGKLEDLCYRSNQVLPKDIALKRIFSVEGEAHARFSASSRTYHYLIDSSKNAFQWNRAWEMRDSISLEAMNQAAKKLLEFQDFTSFSKSNTQTETNLCDVSHAEWTPTGTGYKFEIKANRFLRNMVRAIVGTLIDVGRGKLDQGQFEDIIKSKNRSEAGLSVPAHGLYLMDVEYPKGILNE
ncbi:MAG: tRNA pseudouridine(38-40) synthase TruA [Bacteroidetes bacterium]|nr:tRNA pseudouridine(38-40) synthase TruA [Bacteroidota bacterium]